MSYHIKITTALPQDRLHLSPYITENITTYYIFDNLNVNLLSLSIVDTDLLKDPSVNYHYEVNLTR